MILSLRKLNLEIDVFAAGIIEDDKGVIVLVLLLAVKPLNKSSPVGEQSGRNTLCELLVL